MMNNVGLIVVLSCFTLAALAIGPHELLVLANERSSNSIEIAREYAALRRIPEINVVPLNLPGPVGGAVEITAADFVTYIWTPALRAMRERGIGDHILAWAYSTDFPTTVKTAPTMSIQGMTFLRTGRAPPDRVEKGTYGSPLFAGPNPAVQGSEMHPSATLDTFSEWLREDMPAPSMMLGYTGERGNTKETVLKCLRRGVASDRTWPSGTVFFVTSADVRSTCRQWQFAGASQELRQLGVRSEVTRTFPAGRADIMGVMMGSSTVDPGKSNRYLAGSMAEHLTSMAGVFQSEGQTKLSVWIEAGVAGSAGTVVEPMSAWPKFPSARFYVHYANGCSMIESFFQSIRCPLQILLVGDPLARPWAPTNATLRLEGLPGEPVSGTLKVRAEVKSEPGRGYRRFLYLLDGRAVGRDQELVLDTSPLREGPHELRVVAYGVGLVRDQLFVEKTISVGRSRKTEVGSRKSEVGGQ